MRYARADLDLKRQALAQVFPEALGVPRPLGAFGGTARNSGTHPLAEEAVVRSAESALPA
jgi:hypothetical protein